MAAEVERLKTDAESKGLSDEALAHNAKVNLESRRLMSLIDESGLTGGAKDKARHALNRLFFASRVKVGDRRGLDVVRGVFERVSPGAETFLKKKIEELKSGVPEVPGAEEFLKSK
jgi:hypothetical protein